MSVAFALPMFSKSFFDGSVRPLHTFSEVLQTPALLPSERNEEHLLLAACVINITWAIYETVNIWVHTQIRLSFISLPQSLSLKAAMLVSSSLPQRSQWSVVRKNVFPRKCHLTHHVCELYDSSGSV